MKEHGGGLINTDANNGDHYCENDNFDFRRMKMMMAGEVWRKSGGYKANGFVDTDRTTEALNSSIPSFTQHTVVWLADISCHKVFKTFTLWHFPVWTLNNVHFKSTRGPQGSKVFFRCDVNSNIQMLSTMCILQIVIFLICFPRCLCQWI